MANDGSESAQAQAGRGSQVSGSSGGSGWSTYSWGQFGLLQHSTRDDISDTIRNRKTQQSTHYSGTAPSGIAQLRQSTTEQHTPSDHPDAMNIDDYIFSENISTPMGLGLSPSPELNKKDVSSAASGEKSSNAVASAITIKMRKESAQFAVPQSVPTAPHNPRNSDEFNYVQRHIRKTSIDERRVSSYPTCNNFYTWNLLFPLVPPYHMC